MNWEKPRFPRNVVNLAGKVLIGHKVSGLSAPVDDIINNWRSAHAFPLNAIQNALRKKTQLHSRAFFVSQRIKRLASITAKLRRMPSLTLSAMQDIGGCRAVVDSNKQVSKIVIDLKASRWKHHLVKENDYINFPKDTGYRSHHLIYEYQSKLHPAHNGLKIEIQVRTKLQHAWATAVEVVGTMTSQAIKSGEGTEEWNTFFVTASQAFADSEGAPLPLGRHSNRKQLTEELTAQLTALDVENRLARYASVAEVGKLTKRREFRKVKYWLIEFRPQDKKVELKSFQEEDLSIASDYYLLKERSIENQPGAEVVLVSVDSLKSLYRAYPSYFADTHLFIREIKKYLGITNGNGRKH